MNARLLMWMGAISAAVAPAALAQVAAGDGGGTGTPLPNPPQSAPARAIVAPLQEAGPERLDSLAGRTVVSPSGELLGKVDNIVAVEPRPPQQGVRTLLALIKSEGLMGFGSRLTAIELHRLRVGTDGRTLVAQDASP